MLCGQSTTYKKAIYREIHLVEETKERMHMKAKLLIPLVVIVLTVLTGSLWRRTVQANRTSSPTTTVTKYIQALQAKDRKTITRLAHDVEREIADIKARNPQGPWHNLIAAHYVALARETAQRLDDGTVALFTPGASWKITGSRKEGQATIVYVTIKYPKIEDSPYLGGQFAEEATVVFTLVTSSNLVRDITRVLEPRKTLPLMVVTAAWDTGSGFFRLSGSAIGGKQPYSWTAECGGVTFDTQYRVNEGFGTFGPDEAFFQTTMPQFNAEPVPCVMTITDAVGNVDHGYFTVPKIKTPLMHGYCFYRSPWVNRGVKAGPLCIGGELLPITQTANN